MPPFLAWWMPAKKSVKLPIATGRCKVQSTALCNSWAARGSIFARSEPSADNSAERCRRNARRGFLPKAINGFRVAPAAASAATAASPENSPASNPAGRSRIGSPMATPPRGEPPAGLNTANGRFWIGNSAWPRAEVTQLARRGSWVSSMLLMAQFPFGQLQPGGMILHPGEVRRDPNCGSGTAGDFRAELRRWSRMRFCPGPTHGLKTENQGESQRCDDDCDHRERVMLRQPADQQGAEGRDHHLQEP